MVNVHVIKLILLIACIVSKLGVALLQHDYCSMTKSYCHGSEIRFPFHHKLNQQQENHCVFPSGFELSCAHQPVLKFDYEVKTSVPGLRILLNVEAHVHSIDYKLQKLTFNSKSIDIKQHYNHYYFSNSPFKPFTFKEFRPSDTRYLPEYTFFYNCSSTISYRLSGDLLHPIPSLSDHGFQVLAFYSHLGITEAPLSSCTKLFNISDVPLFEGELSWSEPNCRSCEDKGQYCKFKPNSTTLTQCIPIPKGYSFLPYIAFLHSCYRNKR